MKAQARKLVAPHTHHALLFAGAIAFALWKASAVYAGGSVGAACTTDAECDDGVFCNGTEFCDETFHICVAVSACPPAVDGCVIRRAICDEAHHACVDQPDDSLCDDGVFCNGTEFCDVVTGGCAAVDACPPFIDGCLVGGACDEANHQCLATPDDGLCPAGQTCLPDGACVAPPPRAIKLAVAGQLGGLLPTGDPKIDKQIAAALDHLDKSLDSGLWQDDTHLTNKGEKVFNEEREAVHKLMKIKNAPAALTAEIAAAIQALVGADQALAQTAITEATAALGDPKKIAKALDEMDKAASEVAKGNFDNAIEHYKHAWQQTQQA